jgi:glycosyltransferase involved in cell wall biosynthesis
VKLIVQIPCYNEEATLAETVREIPRQIAGIARVEVLVIDDGSTDRTVEVARAAGVDHLVRHRRNRGLAQAFRTGLDAALARGADLIVNTDADNQYSGADIPALVAPILAGQADIVVGDRQTAGLAHFSRTKRFLQWLGSGLVRRLSQLEVPDAVSGFRAFSREAALRLNVLSSFSYTIETLIQAGRARLAVAVVPVVARPTARRSRLFRSLPQFLERSLVTMVRVYTMYHPLRVFVVVGSLLSLAGVLPIVRFLYFYFRGQGGGHLQSLVLGAALLVIGLVMLLVGLVADLIAFNRLLVEETLAKVRRLELERAAAEPVSGRREALP